MESTLGERLDFVSQHYLTHGYHQVVLINSDGPTLPVEYLKRAFERLDNGPEIVLGPSVDVGYYLICMKNPIHACFERFR